MKRLVRSIIIYSLFSYVDDVTLNGTQIISSMTIYAYRAYLETLLNYGLAAKMSQLTSVLFYEDEAGKLDKLYPRIPDSADKNIALNMQADFASVSKVIDMIGRLHSDIFFQERYMLNEVNLRMKLTRSKDTFALMAAGGVAYSIIVNAASLLICKVKISLMVNLAHAKAFEIGTAK